MKSNLLPKTSDTTQEKLNTLLAEQKQTNPIQPLTKDPRNLVRRTGSAFARMFNIYTQNYGNDEGSIPHQERFLIAKKDSLEAKDRLTKLTVLKTDIKYAKTNQKAIKDINYGIDENASPTQIY